MEKPNPANPREEMLHLLRLASIEMSILNDSLGHLGQTLKGPLSIKECRDFLPWKRGQKLLADLNNLSQHCASLAELLRLGEESEETAQAASTAELKQSS